MTNRILDVVRVAALVACCVAAPAAAQTNGFQLQRHEPAPAADAFFAVEHPWYSSQRDLAVGLSLDYSLNPLRFRHRGDDGQWTSTEVVTDQLAMHLDVAGALFDRVQLSASFPFVLAEDGEPGFGIAPNEEAVAGDPRFGLMARIWGHGHRDVLSVHAGAYVWAPVDAVDAHAGDAGVRVLPRLVLAGTSGAVRWSATLGYLYREAARVGTGQGPTANAVGSEVRVGAAVAWVSPDLGLSIGPEVGLSTFADEHAFEAQATALDLLLGAQYLGWTDWQVGLGLGTSAFQAAGAPDFRVLFRVAWAPGAPFCGAARESTPPRRSLSTDGDGDGVPDAFDRCPAHAGLSATGDGCPPASAAAPAGAADTDGDGIPDARDRCPTEREDVDGDRDDDGCPDVERATPPDPVREGRCVRVDQPGCAGPDRDRDGVPDARDLAPDEPETLNAYLDDDGAPDEVPQRLRGAIGMLLGVTFESGSDVLTPAGAAALERVAAALNAVPGARIEVHAHTDVSSDWQVNKQLSQRQAASVRRHMVRWGVTPGRITAIGFGSDRPVVPGAGARNEWVEIHVVR